jgi:hypothetical protein
MKIKYRPRDLYFFNATKVAKNISRLGFYEVKKSQWDLQ